MMATVLIHSIVLLLFVHWLFDFVMQTNWLIQNKSPSNFTLLNHVVVYGLGMVAPAFVILGSVQIAFEFAALSALLHFAIDFFISRAASYAYQNGKVSSVPNLQFWSVVGFGQFLHAVCLIYTLYWFI